MDNTNNPALAGKLREAVPLDRGGDAGRPGDPFRREAR
jgi:hypothetical protein